MSWAQANAFSILADEHFADFRMAMRDRRPHDAKRHMRLHQHALAVARAIETYRKEKEDPAANQSSMQVNHG